MNSYRTILTSLVVAIAALSLHGCATPAKSTVDYSPPEPIVVPNELTVDDKFDEVWDRLVGRLAKGFFVVNNIEKESRLINVSFATTDPEDYIDCGETFRTFTQYKKNSASVNYRVAEDSSFKWGGGMDASGMNAIVHYVDRSTSLEGRINIYVAPKENGTNVSVNVRYILTIRLSGTTNTEHSTGRVIQSQPLQAPQPDTVSFNTNQPVKSADELAADEMACVSKGVLEQQILDMAVST